MERKNLLMAIPILGLAVALAWSTAASAQDQPAAPQSGPQLSAEQQKQLDQLKQLEQQLQKDREAVHNAITQFGWDSDQVDQAQEQLMRDRLQYRKLRRSLRAQGVPVPPPQGIGPGWPGGRGWQAQGRGYGRGAGMYRRPYCCYRNW